MPPPVLDVRALSVHFVNTTGAGVHHFDLPNVLFIGKKVQMIEDMLREKAVVKGR